MSETGTENSLTNARRYRIHTDGGCRRNPGLGGWGAVLQIVESNADGETIVKEAETKGAEPQTTNNRMELIAAIKSLECLSDKSMPVTVVSDSEYLVKGMNEWINGWIRRGWRNGKGKPVENLDLWQQLDTVAQVFHEIRWEWIKGHAGHPLNERADQLANAAMDALEAKLKARRKLRSPQGRAVMVKTA
ncbi:ribonuclease HI [Metarhizobium album]|uniref:Ribonuclease H n=1 Tax=Metarhizobium album TaxID=2182425 RepID=A0A2U2DSF2_9HYPH|nr:ribonuclease HI [Rhizobium album]PWE56227.1 ribonuclease HI [Rhizobium album]